MDQTSRMRGLREVVILGQSGRAPERKCPINYIRFREVEARKAAFTGDRALIDNLRSN